MKRYFAKEYWDTKKDRHLWLSFRMGKWKASDYVGEIKDKVHVLPTLCFYFNSSEIFVSAAWLVFDAVVVYTDYTKKRIV